METDIQIFNIPGFNIIRKDRNRFGGGVAIIYRDFLTCREFDMEIENAVDSKIEILCCKFQITKRKSFIVTSLYRPKFTLASLDIETIDHIFHQHIQTQLHFYICGDYNIHSERKSDPSVTKFHNILKRLNLVELVTAPTRGASQIDLIITNDISTDHKTTVLHPHLSDHAAPVISKNFERLVRPKKKIITFRSYHKMDTGLLGHEVVHNLDLIGLKFLTVSEACQSFTSKVRTLFDKYAQCKHAILLNANLHYNFLLKQRT